MFQNLIQDCNQLQNVDNKTYSLCRLMVSSCSSALYKWPNVKYVEVTRRAKSFMLEANLCVCIVTTIAMKYDFNIISIKYLYAYVLLKLLVATRVQMHSLLVAMQCRARVNSNGENRADEQFMTHPFL